MPVAIELPEKEYYAMWQEEINKITEERAIAKIVISGTKGSFSVGRIGYKSCAPIIEEARAKVNNRYSIKSDTE